MALTPNIYLVDNDGTQWLVGLTNSAVIQLIPVSGQAAVPYVYVNSVSDGSSWAISVLTTGAGTQLQTTNVAQGSYLTQLPVTAPNGVTYGIQVATVGPPLIGTSQNGILQTAFLNESYTCNTPISTLAGNVLERLEENYPGGPVFWSEQFEIYTAIVEAMNDLMMLVGRPTQTVSVPFNLQPNTPWQQVPKGVFLISDIQGPQAPLRKYTLFSYDYEQPGSIGSDWENDSSTSGPTSWAPVGLNLFIVHPACAQPQTVLISGIAYPVAETSYPYTGAETVPFHHEFFEYLEMYAAHYARIKEGSAEFQQSMTLYQNYLQGAKRLTELETRKDPLIFSPSLGAPAGVNSHTAR